MTLMPSASETLRSWIGVSGSSETNRRAPGAAAHRAAGGAGGEVAERGQGRGAVGVGEGPQDHRLVPLTRRGKAAVDQVESIDGRLAYVRQGQDLARSGRAHPLHREEGGYPDSDRRRLDTFDGPDVIDQTPRRPHRRRPDVGEAGPDRLTRGRRSSPPTLR